MDIKCKECGSTINLDESIRNQILDKEIVNGQPKVRVFWSKLINDLPNLKNRPTLEGFFG